MPRGEHEVTSPHVMCSEPAWLLGKTSGVVSCLQQDAFASCFTAVSILGQRPLEQWNNVYLWPSPWMLNPGQLDQNIPQMQPKGALWHPFLPSFLLITKPHCQKTILRCCSVTLSCPTLCDPMNYSTPGFPVIHYLPELAQTHVHRVSDAIQPSHPLSCPSPPALSLSQHQGLLQRVNFLHQMTKVLESKTPESIIIFYF